MLICPPISGVPDTILILDSSITRDNCKGRFKGSHTNCYAMLDMNILLQSSNCFISSNFMNFT